MGFDGVELAIREPKRVSASDIDRLARKHRLAIAALGTGQAYGEEGLSFTAADPSVRARAVERIGEHLALAKELGVIVILGLIRGRQVPELSEAEVRRVMMDGFQACADEAEKLGVDLAIEPINRYETNLLNTVTETLAVLAELKSSRVGILVDTFHMNIEEPSIKGSIRAAARLIKHVHVADSNRWAPGFGHLDFCEIVNELREGGYDGFLSAEILPYPDPDAAARQAASTLATLR